MESARFSGFLAGELDVDARSVWVDIVGEHAELFAPLDVSRLKAMFRRGRIEKALRAADQETRFAAGTIRALSENLGDQRAAGVARKLRLAMKDRMEPELLEAICSWLKEDLRWRLAPPATRYAIAASASFDDGAGAERSRNVIFSSSLARRPRVVLPAPGGPARKTSGDTADPAASLSGFAFLDGIHHLVYLQSRQMWPSLVMAYPSSPRRIISLQRMQRVGSYWGGSSSLMKLYSLVP